MLDFLGSLFGKQASVSNEDDDRYWSPLAGIIRKTVSGVAVHPQKALGLAAYFACVRNLGEDCAKLPLIVFASNKSGGEPDPTHPLYPVLKTQPNPEVSAFTFRETMTSWAAGWGNAYAEIVRDGGGQPRELWPIHPSRVVVKRSDGRIVYYVRAEDLAGDVLEFEPADIFHLHGLGDGLVGWSVAAIAAEALGIALAQQDYAAAFYGNGASVGVVLKHPGKLSDTARANLRESWNRMHGGARNANKLGILEEGLDVAATSVNPRDSQFIEGRQFQVEDVCRWFRMPPHKVQHLLRSTFSNIEHSNIDYVTDTLMPWLIRWEQECQRKLLGLDERHYAKHRVQALLRGDSQARGQFYSQLFQIGALSANDIRGLEDMPRIDGAGGDAHFVQGALMPIETQLKAQAPGTAPAGAAPKPANAPKPDKPAEGDEESAS